MRCLTVALAALAALVGSALLADAQPAQNPPRFTSGQVKIAVTGTAVQVPAYGLVNGLSLKAKVTNNTACGTVGPPTVTNVADGTGNGWILCPGEGMSFGLPDTALLYVNGTAGDIFSFYGN